MLREGDHAEVVIAFAEFRDGSGIICLAIG